ncbi:MAG: hypothetical protein GF372_03465 [Candidatus Marinimicrobia bacterium]|nr:hypothetical protein [Candidatus Neomarinimicrobiota bacterium]
MDFLRNIFTRIRRYTVTTTRSGSRFLRISRYLFHLLIWSRVKGILKQEIPGSLSATVLEKKGIHKSAPSLVFKNNNVLHHIEMGFSAVYAVLFGNLRTGNELTSLRHSVPGPAFAGVYLWDSAFIALIWKDWDVEVAREILLSVIELRDGDRLQHVVAGYLKSKFTQPPLIGWAAVEVAQQMNSKQRLDFYREIYEPLTRFHQWLKKNRSLPSGLYAWEHPYESGKENAPRFSSIDESELKDTRTMAATDFSAYMVLDCEALETISRAIGESRAAQEFHNEADNIRMQMNQLLWNEEDGLFYDRDHETGEFFKSNTIASLIPLVAGVPEPARAEKLMDHILDTRAYNTPIPLPSVALNDPDFVPDMWRGPVWINTAYLVLKGMYQYGKIDEWKDLSWRLIHGVYKVIENEKQIYEFYDPRYFHTHNLNRKKGNLWKAITLGTGPQKEFVGWSGLVNTLLLELLFGPDNRNEQTLHPHLPEQMRNCTMIVSLPEKNMTLRMKVDHNQKINGRISQNGFTGKFTGHAGQEISTLDSLDGE